MKQIFLLLLLINVIFLNAQENDEELKIDGKYYFITTPATIGYLKPYLLKNYNSDLDKNKDATIENETSNLMQKNSEAVEIMRGHIVRIIDLKDDYVYFKYLPFIENTDEQSRENAKPNLRKKYNEYENGKTKIFVLKKSEFLKYTRVYFNRKRGFGVGAYSVPVRWRNSKGVYEFDSNLSVGSNLLYRISMNRKNENSFVDFSTGLSVTKVNLNAVNSDLGKAGTDYENVDVLNPTALTFTLGITLNLAKNINVGSYYGWDFLSTADQKTNWIYNKKPWLGFGVNITFTNDKNDNTSGGGENK